jgi:hypothetical protein
MMLKLGYGDKYFQLVINNEVDMEVHQRFQVEEEKKQEEMQLNII